jgi:hypothetical protein
MQSITRGHARSVAIAALAAFWLALANWFHPVLRLAMDYANCVALWLLLLLPWGAAIVAFARITGRTRWLVLALTIPAIVVGAVPFAMTSLDLLVTPVGESDGIYTPIGRLPLPHGGTLVIYRTNCGAMCDYGVVVRQERTLVPGLLLVRNIYQRYHAQDAAVEILAPDLVRVEKCKVHLRSWIYL